MINLLVELAGLEEDLALADTTLAHHATRERDLRQLQAEYEEDAASARTGDQDANVRLKGKENEIRAVETELTLKRDQIVGVSDRRQYKALQKEIATLEQRLVATEDEAMALLTEVEEAAVGRTEAEADRLAQSSRGQAEIERMDGETEQAGADSGVLAQKIADRIALLPEAVKRHILRLRQNGGLAVVRVVSGACGGCFGQLPAQKAIDADKGRAVVRCAGCARYVVHKPWR